MVYLIVILLQVMNYCIFIEYYCHYYNLILTLHYVSNKLFFSETLANARGNYTKDTVRRAGKMVGTLAKGMDEAFLVQVAETTSKGSYRKRCDYKDDVEAFVRKYRGDDLFGFHPGRQHPSFPGFDPTMSFKNPERLKERFIRYAKKLNNQRNLRV